MGVEPHPATAPAGSNGAGMEVTKCLKPSGKRATNGWQRECAGRNVSEVRQYKLARGSR